MAELWLNKKLPEYFVECDYADDVSMDRLAHHYENEKVILLRNKRVDFDTEFFSKVSLPTTREYKKFNAASFIRRADRRTLRRFSFIRDYVTNADAYPNIARDCFGGDRKKAEYFRSQVASILKQIEAILTRAAPGYRIREQRFTLRCSPTINENLHVDVYKEDIPTHHFRVFVNLDNAHRIWHTSWRLSDLLADRLGSLSRADLTELSAGQLMRKLNFHTFGGYDSSYEDREPRHAAFFEPGEIWFVDSRKIAHQIFYGRRAISSESVVENQNMADPASHYLAMVERHRQQLLAA